jgi:hypothetical protein
MNSFLLDAPIFVARYTAGTGYQRIDPLFAPAIRGRLCCSVLGLAEVVATLVSLRRRGKYSPGFFAAATLQFRLDVLQPTHFAKLPLTSSQAEASLGLIDKHQLDSSSGILVRVCLDQAGQLRSAGHDLVLVSLSRRLLRVARQEGLLTFNPETGSDSDLTALLGP